MRYRRPFRFIALSLALSAPALLVGPNRVAEGDDVLLKSGLTLRGTVEKDNALRMVSDELKRIYLRDTRIQSVTPAELHRNQERFRIEQPLTIHAGGMPVYAIDVKPGPWNEKGRRSFSYVGPRSSKPIVINQAINALGPYYVNYRGIDGFWKSQISTRQIPKEVVLGILAKVDRKILNERQRVARFMLQAGWLDEAKKEVESIAKDFPEERENLKVTLQAINDLDLRAKREEIDRAIKARRPKRAKELLKAYPADGLPSDLEKEVGDLRKSTTERDAADRKLAEAVRETAKALSAEKDKAWKDVVAEILKNLDEAPDAVRDRLEPFSKPEGAKDAVGRLALAITGWIAGPSAAVSEPDLADALLKARLHLRGYLTAKDDAGRAMNFDALSLIELPRSAEGGDSSSGKLDPATLSRIVPLAIPPFSADAAEPGKVLTHRVIDDFNPTPTDYMVVLPPEYHPLRSYPTILALHDGDGPRKAIDWWRDQAARRGFIVVAPEYRLPDQPKNYRYSISEHAAIELSLRDALKRYAIDSDRVFLAGNMLGGNVAIDFGLAHPDLFAGVASVSGLPAKYAYAYRKNAGALPLYFALGDLAPGAKEVMFDMFVKPMLFDSGDVLYTEYIARGHEDLPEEAETILDWMEKYKRDPAPKSFDVFTARPSDARFWGVVVQEISAGRRIAPEAADALGANVKPAKISMKVSSLTNLVNVTVNGVDKLDVWLSPKTIDFKKRIEVRINGKTYYKGLPKPDLGPMLTDLRFRGDRRQLYWLKVGAGR